MKKVYTLFLFLAASLFSLTASAGYVQYNLTDNNGNNLGYFVQHDDDKTIAYYDFLIGAGDMQNHFVPVRGYDYMKVTSTAYKGQGPTNLGVFDIRTPDYSFGAYIYFIDPDATSSPYKFTMDYVRTFTGPVATEPVDHVLSINGFGSMQTVDADLVAMLDSYGGYAPGVTRVVPFSIWDKPEPGSDTPPPPMPGEVPEPAGLALLGIGALSLQMIRRKRQA